LPEESGRCRQLQHVACVRGRAPPPAFRSLEWCSAVLRGIVSGSRRAFSLRGLSNRPNPSRAGSPIFISATPHMGLTTAIQGPIIGPSPMSTAARARISSVSPAPEPCAERACLVSAHSLAAAKFAVASRALGKATGLDFNAALSASKAAGVECAEAHRELTRHKTEHGCEHAVTGRIHWKR
jgi:hypothetical protein